ncbi:MAG TPA: hypothetical protein VN452_05010 [Longilinea sp.]|nr:hypothetical protein [Longilinea sp.]
MSSNRIKWIGGIVCLFLIVAGCAHAQPTDMVASPVVVQAEQRALLNEKGSFFSTAGQCSACHTGLITSGGNDISIDTDWRSTMMANSARDPYYRASVRREILANPGYDEFIQNKCSTCHVPMAHFTTSAAGGKTIMLDDGVFAAANSGHSLAMDGVSCTVCHQIQAENLGTDASFSGGLVFDERTASGKRQIFGQFPVADNWVSVMNAASGFAPLQAGHTEQSALCATCHNLFTPYITNDGKVSEELFPEQTPFTEWENSAYAKDATCQSCHMLDAGETAAISSVNPEKRSPFRQHQFIGGNQFMLNLLKKNGDPLDVTATDDQFEQTIRLTDDQLSSKTAELSVKPGGQGSTLDLDIKITNLAGHKFPTSFPSRRVWLHVRVEDAGGGVVFESGNWSDNGAISGNINDQDAAQFEPHYTEITFPDQVQIYETIIGDPDGEVTTTLLRAQHYIKDNRLLPAGMAKDKLPNEIAVQGPAVEDEDFYTGGDSVKYVIQLPGSGTYSVSVELLYQSVGYRWAENLRGIPFTAEAESFLAMLKESPLSPVLVAQNELNVTLP